MSTSRVIEEESGVITRGRHPHNGYYAGDFSTVPFGETTTGTDRRMVDAARASAGRES